MGNWFERNAAKSIIVYTTLIMGATFAFYKFTFEERKLDNYRSQIVSVQTEINQHKARIEYLERENLKLKMILKEFEDWNENSSNPTLFYKSQYEKLILQESIPSEFEDFESFQENIRLSKSNVFKNDKFGIIVGLKEVSVTKTCDLNISFRENENNSFRKVEVGKIITLESEDKQVKLVVEQIDYVYSSIIMSIKITNKN